MSAFLCVSQDNQIYTIPNQEELKAFFWSRDANKYSCYIADSGILKQVIVNTNLSVEPFYKVISDSWAQGI